jgi:hypothetical protein
MGLRRNRGAYSPRVLAPAIDFAAQEAAASASRAKWARVDAEAREAARQARHPVDPVIAELREHQDEQDGRLAAIERQLAEIAESLRTSKGRWSR